MAEMAGRRAGKVCVITGTAGSTGLALEGSEHGIRVNSISPGFIETNASVYVTGIDRVVDGGMKVW